MGQAPPGLLDDRHLIVRTLDPDRARREVGAVYVDAAWTFLRSSGAEQPLQLHSVSFGRFGLSTMRYGREVRVQPKGHADVLMVIAVTRGRVRFARGKAAFDGARGTVVAVPVDDALDMTCSADAETCKFMFRRERAQALHARLADGPAGALDFGLAAGNGLHFEQWLSCARMLAEVARHGPDVRDALSASIEEVLLTTLLRSQPLARCAALEPPGKGLSPAHVRRATAWIEAHLEDDLTLERIAEAAGCSMRSLQRGFRDSLDMTPARFIRALRLQRVRLALQDQARVSESITQLALAHGFGHLGEFSASYRQAFGELPSQTRRAS